MHLLRNALHLTHQAKCHHCLGCHFELKQVGFTATYRPRQCLLTSRNIKFSIFRAGVLEPHGSESCTWHNNHGRYACAHATPRLLGPKQAPCVCQRAVRRHHKEGECCRVRNVYNTPFCQPAFLKESIPTHIAAREWSKSSCRLQCLLVDHRRGAVL
jgi:hypothetical protein